jgi:anthranilate/para-aminobenzoate synthase component II
VEIIRHFAGRVPILGVCLGHQCLAYAFGGKIVPAKKVMHGKLSRISTTERACSKASPRASQRCGTTL